VCSQNKLATLSDNMWIVHLRTPPNGAITSCWAMLPHNSRSLFVDGTGRIVIGDKIVLNVLGKRLAP